MSPSPESDDADLFDFVDELHRDREKGREHTLEHYRKRYPGRDAALAREYERICGAASAEIEPAHEPSDDRRIGPYRLVRELGSGGQGAVWLAEDTRIARQVALKFMPSSFALLSADRRRRFQREAEVVSRLEHPSICPIYEAQVEHDPPYIAMRAVDGETLAAVIARARAGQQRADEALVLPPRTPVELRRVLAFFERAARALHAAHEAGVVHRDIKPGNVMVTRAGEPVILDFGQARDERAELHERTLSGEVFGTPAYMSPEQVEGSSHGVDRRSDVWSLGASLYEALTLHRPFLADTVAALLQSIRTEPIPNPRGRGGVLDEDTAVVLETALEKDLARRYASALDFAEDLRRIREYEPIRARPASALLKLRRWAQRHPALAVALAAVTVALGGAVYLGQRERDALEREAAALKASGAALQRELEARQREDAALDNVLGRYLAMRSADLLADDPAAALALGLRAVDRAPSYATRSALFAALEQCWLDLVLTTPKDQLVADLDIAADGRRVVGALGDGSACVWDLERRERVAEFAVSTTPLEFVRTDAELGIAVFASSEPALHIHSLEDGRALARRDGYGAPWGCLERLASRRFVALARNGRGCVVDAASGSVIASFELEAERYNRIVSDPAGRYLIASSAQVARASALRANDAILLDASDGRVLARLEGHTDAISDSDVSPDGSVAATASLDGTVRLWSLPSGAALGDPLQHGVPLSTVRFAAGGRELVVGTEAPGDASRVLRWDLASRTASVLETSLGDRVQSIDVSRADGAILAATRDPGLAMWSASGAPVRTLSERLRPVSSRWTPDGRRVITHGLAPFALVWWSESRPDIYSLQGHEGAIVRAEFSPSGSRALTLSADGSARIWHSPRGPRERGAPPHGAELARAGDSVDEVAFATFAPDDRALVVLRDGRAGWLSPQSTLDVFADAGPDCAEVRFEPGASQRFLLGREDGRVFLWDGARFVELAQGVRAFTWAGPSRCVCALDGQRLVFFDIDGPKAVHEATWTSARGSAEVVELAARPDGAELAAACADGRLRFFDTTSREPLRPAKDLFLARELAYDRTGGFLLAVGAAGRGVVRTLDLALQKPVVDRVTHTGPVTGGAFHERANLALSCSRDRSVYVREVATGEPVTRRTDFPAEVTCSAFSRDDGEPRVISGCADGSAHIWPVDPTSAARARRPRELYRWEEERERRFAAPLPFR